jgi:hypothetical protein
MTKVINFFGAPASGKTTTALGLSYYAKRFGLNIEYVPEFARELAYKGKLQQTRQYDILMEQYSRIAILNNKVDYVITDSPIMLGYVYTDDVNVRAITKDRANEFTNVNFLMCREHEYSQGVGRIHTEQQADFIADRIDDMLEIEKIPHIKVWSNALDQFYFYRMLLRFVTR